MSGDILSYILTAAITFSVTLSVIIFFVFYQLERQKGAKDKPAEVGENFIEEIEKSDVVVHEALNEAKKTMARAEMEGMELINKLKSDKEKFELEQRQRVRDLVEEMRQKFNLRTAEAEQVYTEFLKTLEEKMSYDIEKKETELSEKIENFFRKSENLLSSFVKQLEEKTTSQLDAEIGNAKRIVDEYREQRMLVIDENIVAILEKTLNITLGKKLTLSDQTQLVYEALDEAKKENFFG